MCVNTKPAGLSDQKREAKRQAQAEQERRRRDKMKALEDRRAGESGGPTQSLINLTNRLGTVSSAARSFFSSTGG